jgi:hypothetical protein
MVCMCIRVSVCVNLDASEMCALINVFKSTVQVSVYIYSICTSLCVHIFLLAVQLRTCGRAVIDLPIIISLYLAFSLSLSLTPTLIKKVLSLREWESGGQRDERHYLFIPTQGLCPRLFLI